VPFPFASEPKPASAPVLPNESLLPYSIHLRSGVQSFATGDHPRAKRWEETTRESSIVLSAVIMPARSPRSGV
jgi:hypothetical protein